MHRSRVRILLYGTSDTAVSLLSAKALQVEKKAASATTPSRGGDAIESGISQRIAVTTGHCAHRTLAELPAHKPQTVSEF